MKTFLLVASFVGVTTLTSFAAPIIIRHDRDEAAYLDLGRRHAEALCRLLNDRGVVNGGGTLIAPRWVVTAAHVARGLQPGRALHIGEASYPVEHVVLHPQWRRGAPGHDIALVRLAEAVVGVAPTPLYRGRDEVGRTIVVVGAGMRGTGLTGPVEDDGQIRGATNRIDEAAETWLRFVFDAPDAENATDLEGISGPGDSGGPALLVVDGTAYVAGISSGQDAAATGGQPGRYGVSEYYTRVSSYIPWIEQTIQGAGAGVVRGDPAEERAANGKQRMAPAAGAPGDKWRFPDSATGRALNALLTAIDRGDDAHTRRFVEQHLEDTFLDAYSLDEHVAFFRDLHDQLPALEVEQVVKTGPYSVDFMLVSGQTGHTVKATLTLAPQPPHRFVGLDVQPVEPK